MKKKTLYGSYLEGRLLEIRFQQRTLLEVWIDGFVLCADSQMSRVFYKQINKAASDTDTWL